MLEAEPAAAVQKKGEMGQERRSARKMNFGENESLTEFPAAAR